jgi:hypothetical protein
MEDDNKSMVVGCRARGAMCNAKNASRRRSSRKSSANERPLTVRHSDVLFALSKTVPTESRQKAMTTALRRSRIGKIK